MPYEFRIGTFCNGMEMDVYWLLYYNERLKENENIEPTKKI